MRLELLSKLVPFHDHGVLSIVRSLFFAALRQGKDEGDRWLIVFYPEDVDGPLMQFERVGRVYSYTSRSWRPIPHPPQT
jgi:hypothetical protein